MPLEKDKQEKSRLHPRNKNKGRYNLEALIGVCPELKNHIATNKYGTESIDFSNPRAVRLLNTAILHHHYGIAHWEFPKENLCPPIPGRADYLHHIADLLAENNFGKIPKGEKITGLDIGMGASCIYSIIGVSEYGWKFIGSETDRKSLASAERIVQSNPSLKGKIACKLQDNPKKFFHRILDREEKVDFALCNPPFHASAEDAQKGAQRKIRNLSGKQIAKPELNFSGISSELIYEGGELEFIRNMILESTHFSRNCLWFSSLVSKQSHLNSILQLLEKAEAIQSRTIPMGTGNKSSRMVAWSFLSKKERKAWRETRW